MEEIKRDKSPAQINYKQPDGINSAEQYGITEKYLLSGVNLSGVSSPLAAEIVQDLMVQFNCEHEEFRRESLEEYKKVSSKFNGEDRAQKE